MTVTDQYGCSDDTTVTVEEPILLNVDTTFQDSVSCNGLSDGSATALFLEVMGITVIYVMQVLEVRRLIQLQIWGQELIL